MHHIFISPLRKAGPGFFSDSSALEETSGNQIATGSFL
jgi:hypothetical protein